MHYRGRGNDIIEAIICVFALGILVWMGMEENEKSGYICGNINSGSTITIKVW